MTADPRLRELLKRWRLLRREGRPASPEELCRDCPELLPLLQQQLQESCTEVPTVCVPEPAVPLDGVTRSYATGEATKVPVAEPVRREPALTPFQAALVAGADVSGTVLGEYTLLERLGAGGMGVVYKAQHRRLDRLVAVKLMARDYVHSPEAIARFQREGRAAARLSHPKIVTAYDASAHDGVHYLVMEFVAGIDLARRLKRHGPMAPDQAIGCVLQAARALEYAHAQGVVHRDIKPSNLLVDDKGTVKVLDMGLARLRRPGGAGDESQLTQMGVGLGTPDYTAPEQSTDPANADERADIYSLGCTLFSLLTGHTMYREQSLLSKMLAHRDSPIPSLSQQRSDVSPALESVFRRMVAKKPADRYASMTEVIAALEACRIPLATPVAEPIRRGLWFGAAAAAVAALLVLMLAAAAVGLIGIVIRKAPVKGDDKEIVAGERPLPLSATANLTGKWSGLYLQDSGLVGDSPLEIVEEKDGSITGMWEGATIKGKRTGKEEARWESGRQVDGNEYYAVANVLHGGEVLSVTFTQLRNQEGGLVGSGMALVVRTPGAPVRKRVEFAGRWDGIDRFDDDAGNSSPLVLMEAKDGTLTGSWCGFEVKGKRTGDATYEMSGTGEYNRQYKVSVQATNGGHVLRMTYTATHRRPRGPAQVFNGSALVIREE